MQYISNYRDLITSLNFFKQNKDVTKRQQLTSIITSVSIGILFSTLVIGSVGFAWSCVLSLTCGSITYYAITTFFNKKNKQQMAAVDLVTNNDPKTIDEINESALPTQKPVYTGCIALMTRTGGFLGKNEKDTFLDKELVGWTLKNGKEFPVENGELLLQFMIFNQSENFKDVCSKFQLLMPASLFEGKNEGDEINFCYKGQPVSLIINQQMIDGDRGPRHLNKNDTLPSDNIFAEYFQCSKKEVLKHNCEWNTSIFAVKEEIYEGYTLEHNGVLYQFTESCLHKASLQILRIVKSQILGRKPSAEFSKNKFAFPVPGINSLAAIEIVLNDKFLCIYANSHSAEGTEDANDVGTEHLHMLMWKKYFEVTLEEMQNMLTKAKFKLDSGQLIMEVNTNN
jgi:hypothetical protein